jgi:hypothetical protein
MIRPVDPTPWVPPPAKPRAQQNRDLFEGLDTPC